MSTPDHKQPLDYETPRRKRRKLAVRFKYFVPAMLCIGLTYASWSTFKQTAYVMMPAPDPPPKGDPYWVQQGRDQIWLPVSCCGAPLFGIAGLVLLLESFRLGESRDEGWAE